MSELPPLELGVAHIWRLDLDDTGVASVVRQLLSASERARADRFYTEVLRRRYTVAHGWKRRILSRYAKLAPDALEFEEGEFGKPSLAGRSAASGIHFNLSHSAGMGLLAISRAGPIGVDVEQWDRGGDHLNLADHFFSPVEREALQSLVADAAAMVAGFFAAWTRKEAYLKATGHGISRGLHHFDVSLLPDAPATLAADRLDEAATSVWQMASLDVGPGYSAAVVARAPLAAALLFDAVATDPRWR